MKRFFLAAVLGLAACQTPADSLGEEDVTPQSSSGDLFLFPVHGQEPGCQAYAQHVGLPGGGSVIVLIPALCSPFFLDTGDPPPDGEQSAEEEELSNPDPTVDPIVNQQGERYPAM